jgi:hypothetical protein
MGGASFECNDDIGILFIDWGIIERGMVVVLIYVSGSVLGKYLSFLINKRKK